MPYRIKLPDVRKRWVGTTLPGNPGCWAIIAIGLMLISTAGVAALIWKLLVASGLVDPLSAFVLAAFLSIPGGFLYLLALKRADRAFKYISVLTGRIDLVGDQLDLRLPGLRPQCLRFSVGRSLEIRCASTSTSTHEENRTLLMLRQGDEVAACTSPEKMQSWHGKIEVEAELFLLPPNVPMLNLEHTAINEIMLAIDEQLGSQH